MYSIVIATCNRIDFLVQTINCIFHQEYLPTSVIVIDSSDDDFSNQKSWLHEVLDDFNSINGTDHVILFLPKFHCELNWIENVWGYFKWSLRSTCTYNFGDLVRRVNILFKDVRFSL